MTTHPVLAVVLAWASPCCRHSPRHSPGIIGDVGIGYFLDKTHMYKTGFLTCNAGAIIA